MTLELVVRSVSVLGFGLEWGFALWLVWFVLGLTLGLAVELKMGGTRIRVKARIGVGFQLVTMAMDGEGRP